MYSPTNPMPAWEETAVRYKLDAAASRFRVQAFAAGLLAPFAHSPVIAIRRFSGEVFLDPGSIEQSSLTLTVDNSSFEVESDLSAKDRREILRVMHHEVLEIDTHAEIRYECNSVSGKVVGKGRFWVVLDGSLSLHGVSRAQKIAASLVLHGDIWRASGDFSIRQSDFGIKLVSAAAGTLKAKDEVKCSFDIVGRKAE